MLVVAEQTFLHLLKCVACAHAAIDGGARTRNAVSNGRHEGVCRVEQLGHRIRIENLQLHTRPSNRRTILKALVPGRTRRDLSTNELICLLRLSLDVELLYECGKLERTSERTPETAIVR